MQDIFRFIQSVETEVSTVQESLRVAAHHASEVRKYLDEVQSFFEEFAEKNNVALDFFEPPPHSLGSQDLIRLLNLTKALESGVRSTLGLAGLRLDNIRGKVIGAKIKFGYIEGSEDLFFAIDKLVSALDFVCVSIASNISEASSVVKWLGSA